MPKWVFPTLLKGKFRGFLIAIALLFILAIGNDEIRGQVGHFSMRHIKTERQKMDIYEYVCPLSRAVFATLPESAGSVGKIPASVVAGMCSTIIRRMVEEIHRTGASALLESLIMGDTVRPFYKEKGRYLSKEELVERSIHDLKERKHTQLLMCVLREIMLDFTADVAGDVCAEQYKAEGKAKTRRERQ